MIKVHLFANALLSLCATMTFAASPRSLVLEPHVVLELSQSLSKADERCLDEIAASQIRFCAGESQSGQGANLEVHLRADYRGEWGVAGDREQVLKEAHVRLVRLCGISPGLDADAFAEIIGTPLTALGNPKIAEAARSILETTSQYYYGLSFVEGMQEGIRTSPRSRCRPDAFYGM